MLSIPRAAEQGQVCKEIPDEPGPHISDISRRGSCQQGAAHDHCGYLRLLSLSVAMLSEGRQVSHPDPVFPWVLSACCHDS